MTYVHIVVYALLHRPLCDTCSQCFIISSAVLYLSLEAGLFSSNFRNGWLNKRRKSFQQLSTFIYTNARLTHERGNSRKQQVFCVCGGEGVRILYGILWVLGQAVLDAAG